MNQVLSLTGKNSIFTDTNRDQSDKLIFVKRIPGIVTAEEFAQIVVGFAQKGPIIDLKYRRHTGGDKTAFALIYFESEEDGRNAINQLNGRHIEHYGQSRILSAERAARWSQQVSKTNLYVTNLPGHWTGEDLKSVFDKYGNVLQATVLPHPQIEEQNSGAGFVRFSIETDAATALKETDNKAATPGSQHTLEVKYAKANMSRRRMETRPKSETATIENKKRVPYPTIKVPSIGNGPPPKQNNNTRRNNRTTPLQPTNTNNIKTQYMPKHTRRTFVPLPSQHPVQTDYRKRKAENYYNPHPAKRFRSANFVSQASFLPSPVPMNPYMQGTNQIQLALQQQTAFARLLAANQYGQLLQAQNNIVPAITNALGSSPNFSPGIPTGTPPFSAATTPITTDPSQIVSNSQEIHQQQFSLIPTAQPYPTTQNVTEMNTAQQQQQQMALLQQQQQNQLYQAAANRLMMVNAMSNNGFVYPSNNLVNAYTNSPASTVTQGQIPYVLNPQLVNNYSVQPSQPIQDSVNVQPSQPIQYID